MFKFCSGFPIQVNIPVLPTVSAKVSKFCDLANDTFIYLDHRWLSQTSTGQRGRWVVIICVKEFSGSFIRGLGKTAMFDIEIFEMLNLRWVCQKPSSRCPRHTPLTPTGNSLAIMYSFMEFKYASSRFPDLWHLDEASLVLVGPQQKVQHQKSGRGGRDYSW